MSRQEVGGGLPIILIIVKRRNFRPWTSHDPSVLADADKQMVRDGAADGREHKERAAPPSKHGGVTAAY